MILGAAVCLVCVGFSFYYLSKEETVYFLVFAAVGILSLVSVIKKFTGSPKDDKKDDGEDKDGKDKK